jgi:hypothetical protein
MEVFMKTDPQVNNSDVEKAKQELLAIHAGHREAHFATDAQALTANQAESYIYVRDGAIHHTSRDASLQQFEQYFENATYDEWDDLEPPIVQVSQDATLAWMITRTKVRRVQIDESGNQHEQAFVYAGIMTYEKRDGQWVYTANVSTFE